jgi:hypothetical protein
MSGSPVVDADTGSDIDDGGRRATVAVVVRCRAGKQNAARSASRTFLTA